MVAWNFGNISEWIYRDKTNFSSWALTPNSSYRNIRSSGKHRKDSVACILNEIFFSGSFRSCSCRCKDTYESKSIVSHYWNIPIEIFIYLLFLRIWNLKQFSMLQISNLFVKSAINLMINNILLPHNGIRVGIVEFSHWFPLAEHF